MAKRGDRYNSEPFGTPKRSSDGSYIGTLLVIVLLALTMSLSVALLIAYLTPVVSPSLFGSLTIMGIFTPILYISVVICLLIWIVMGRWKIAGVVALLLVPGLFRLSDFYNVDYMRKVEQKPSRNTFTVMSYNVRGFRNDGSLRAVDNHAAYLAECDLPDIFCFQEYQLDIPNVERIDSVLRTRHSKLYMRDAVESGNVVLRTYSRYPIIASGELSGEGRGTSQWVDVVVGKSDTIRVFNNHLHSMDISSADSSDIANGTILNDGDRMQSIVERIAKNSSIRAEYVDTLRTIIDDSPYRNVICGDFNDTPMSYVYRVLKRHHIDAFEQAGSGYGYTFRPMHSALRIDYILHSKQLDTEHYFVDEENYVSDHLPIFARLKIVPKEKK